MGGRGERPTPPPQSLRQSTGMKRTLPLKYSTNLTTEAKGQWVGWLPPEEAKGSRPAAAVAPSLLGFGCSLSTEWGEGRRGDGTVPSTSPWAPHPQHRHSTLPTSPDQGDSEVCDGIQGNLFLLPFLGAAWAKPFPSRLGCQPHTGKVEPLDGTIRVVTANHLSIGDLVTKAICGFVGIHGHIQYIRGVYTAKGRRGHPILRTCAHKF